jgi:2-polyprenyl-3-methyl-5-hydroxy-6-metoxy-1,4-benzoquinol methylase
MIKSEIKKEDYYGNMYDIESLTNLNKKRKKQKLNPAVLKIENYVRRNKCQKAKLELEILFSNNNHATQLQIIYGALWVKDRTFSSTASNYQDLSPKNCASEELSQYLKVSKEKIKKKMLVEKPVAEAWKKMNPNPENEEEIDNFYIKVDAYIYELMAANNIVQTLYSYYVLSQKLKKLKIKTILDYGAGAATLSILFKNLGYDVSYADLPGKLFNFAKWRIKKRRLDIPAFNLQKDMTRKKYDCTICTEFFEHVVNQESLLYKLKSLLNENGVLVISESCKYTEDFSSHLENNKKYGGKNFIKLIKKFGFRQILRDPFIPQMIFERK